MQSQLKVIVDRCQTSMTELAFARLVESSPASAWAAVSLLRAPSSSDLRASALPACPGAPPAETSAPARPRGLEGDLPLAASRLYTASSACAARGQSERYRLMAL